MDMSRAAGPGLRERKKQQTREALSWAALRLAVERGLGNVLVEDIAAEAGVSPRTYNNYFSSKAEAITWRHLDRARRIADLLRARPRGEPLWESITCAVVAQAGGEHASPQPEWTAGVRLMLSEPELQGEFLKAGAAAERECALVIAGRTGTDAGRDMYPRLVAAAIGTAILVANEQWLRAEPPVPLAPLLRDALTQIAAGLPAPATG
ncbi:MAG TPA: TetR family transcriptional regulator [Streptosporangiaceae bacterium]|nr:TetR family transcriptional regulator [Streptosporangiaceae bacterium]